MFRRFRSLLLVASLSLLLPAVLPNPAGANDATVPHPGHVFVIIGENTLLSELSMDKAPYQLGTIKPESAWLTNYWGISHYSTSNYVAMTSGQYLLCHQLDKAPADCNQSVPNLFNELDTAGVSWTEWNESMPQPCYLVNAGASKTLSSYRVKHNPAVYYAGVEGTGGVWSATDRSAGCMNNVISTGGTGPNDTSALDAALAQGTGLARFNFIVPNQCEDAHDNCKPEGNAIKQFDDFLAREIPKIQASPAFGPNDLIIVTYDEGGGGGPNGAQKQAGGNVPFAVIGGLVHPGVYDTRFDHYSLLRTWEDMFGVPTHAGAAASASPIDNIWG